MLRTVRRDLTDGRTMREELDMQAPPFCSEARRKSSLRYAVAGLSENEPSKDVKYFHLL